MRANITVFDATHFIRFRHANTHWLIDKGKYAKNIIKTFLAETVVNICRC